MSAVQIRAADPADADAIAATLREAFLPFEPLYTAASFEATTPAAATLRARWTEGPVWVAICEREVVGTVAAVPRPNELYVRSMAVLPSARGYGVGRELLNTVEEFALGRGYRRMALSTTPFLDSAIRLYQRHGFTTVGESDLFGTPLLLMVKHLRG